MAREHAVIIEESFRIPADAFTFEGFRKWVHTPEFPETGRIDYLAGDIEIDMRPEDLHTHGIVKVSITVALAALVAECEIGEIFVDRTRVSYPFAALSMEPDVVRGVIGWSGGRNENSPSDSR
jgi:hypothetical protein